MIKIRNFINRKIAYSICLFTVGMMQFALDGETKELVCLSNQTELEIESLSKVISIKRKTALSALQNLKRFLNVYESLSFEKLDGGNVNAPILIYKCGDKKTPVGVLKHEMNDSFAEWRMKAIDEMRDMGLKLFPRILKDEDRRYLVKLGDESYSCIEYFNPDADPQRRTFFPTKRRRFFPN